MIAALIAGGWVALMVVLALGLCRAAAKTPPRPPAAPEDWADPLDSVVFEFPAGGWRNRAS